MSIISVKHFWGHKVWRTSVGLHVRLTVLGEAKVDKSHLFVPTKHNVLRLDIAMRYTQCVTVLKSLQAFQNHISGHLFCVRLAIFNTVIMAVKKFTTRTQFHDKIQIVLVIIGFKVLNDVGVVYLLKQVDFIHDRRKVLSRHFILAEYFDSDLIFCALSIRALVNLAEGAFSEYVTVDIVDLFQLMDTCGDVNLGSFLSSLQMQMVLVMATDDSHVLIHPGSALISTFGTRCTTLLAIETAHVSRFRLK